MMLWWRSLNLSTTRVACVLPVRGYANRASAESEVETAYLVGPAGLAGDGQPVARRLARALGAAAAGGSQERIDLTGDDHDHTVVKADPGIAPGRKRKLPGSLRR